MINYHGTSLLNYLLLITIIDVDIAGVDIVVILASLLLLILAHLFKALCVRRSNEVRLHVVDAPLWVHQVLIFFAFDLYHAHHYPIDHVDRLTFIVFTIAAFATFVLLLDILAILVHVVLDTHRTLFFVVDIINQGRASLIEFAIELVLVISFFCS